jgi:putative ABC transport system permease protein
MFIIYNSFAIAVTHRRREVGILRALGATRSQVQRLFLVESAIAGFIGSILGAAAGLAGARSIVQYTSAVMELAGGVAQRVTELSVSPALLIFGIAIGVSTSLLAAWVPARNAARLDPVQALQKGSTRSFLLVNTAVESCSLPRFPYSV